MAKGIASCCISALAVGIVTACYLTAVPFGLTATLLCSPLFVISFALSVLSMGEDDSGPMDVITMVLSIGGLLGTWSFTRYVLTMDLLFGIDSSLANDVWLLSMLNW